MKVLFFLILLSFSHCADGQTQNQVQTESKHITAIDLGYEIPPVYPDFAHRHRQNGRYGFYDANYVYVPFIYDELPKKYSDFMIAKKGEKYGVINRRGEAIIPFIYDKIQQPYLDYKNKIQAEYLEVTKGNLKGVLDKKGMALIDIQYLKLNHFGKGIYIVQTTDKKFGLIAADGTKMTKIIYEQNLTYIAENKYSTKKGGKYGIISRTGNLVLPFEYDYLAKTTYSKYGSYIKVKKDDKMGLLDTTLNQILPLKYDGVQSNRIGQYVVSENEKVGLLDKNFKEIVPLKYDRIEAGNALYYKVRMKKEVGERGNSTSFYGVVDTLGNLILPCDFDRIQFNNDKLILAKKLFKPYEVFNEKGKQIAPPTYSYIEPRGLHIIAKKERGGKYGILNKEGMEITPFIYDRITYKRDKNDRKKVIFVVERDGLKGTLSEDGKEAEGMSPPPPPQKSQYQRFEKILHDSLQGDWYGLVDFDGEKYLQKLIFKDKNYGVRVIYFLEKGKECKITQNFIPVLSQMGSWTLYVKIANRYMGNTCNNLVPKSLQNGSQNLLGLENYSLSTELFSRKIKLEGHTRRINPPNDIEDYDWFRKLKKAKEVETDLITKIESRPGGFTNPSVIVSPTTGELFLGGGFIERACGKIEIDEDGYVLKTKYWEQDNHYSLAGVLKNVKYVDANGKEKIGDLDLCFKASKNQKTWFRETIK